MRIDQMDEEILSAILETMPAEITVIDAQDEVVGWNRHERRLFRRPLTAMGLNFRQCHPEHSLPMVERIIEEMKAGRRDVARFWIDLAVPPEAAVDGHQLGAEAAANALPGGARHKILIEFYALRTPTGEYLGCLEFTQDVEHIRRLEGQKRLLD